MDGAGVWGGQVERLQEELRGKDEMMRYVEEEVRRGEAALDKERRCARYYYYYYYYYMI